MRWPLLLLTTSVLFSASCREEKLPADAKKPAAKKPAKAAATEDLSREIEAFTGSHTRLVWTQCADKGVGDTYTQSERLMLVGIDTRDGTGVRAILPKLGNYSRPLLSTDGTQILWTDKNTVRKDGKKHYKPVIYLTDWKGASPKQLARGYAVDCWRDPATGIEFVYAVQSLKASKALALEGVNLIRFPLHDPSKVEVVYDDTPVTPDNVQLSRSGTRMSGQFPWPHSGVLRFSEGKWTAQKITTGCWSSLAPDDSGLAWTFDGEHRSIMVFADDGAKSWPVPFHDVPGAQGKELYHPRWTNHPRLFVLTGPYMKGRDVDGSVINKGGGSARVVLGRFNEKADKVEAWLQVSRGAHSESYPDAWIEEGANASLAGYSIPSTGTAAPAATDTWPATRTGLLFLWQDRTTLNSFTARDGTKHEGILEPHGVGRYGRFHEILPDSGSFAAEEESGSAAAGFLKNNPGGSMELLVIPHPSDSGRTASLFTAPGFSVQVDQNQLLLRRATADAWRGQQPLPDKPFHLAVLRRADGFDAFVNGEPLGLAHENTASSSPATEAIVFGNGWSGGLQHIAIYDRTLTDEDIAANAEAAQKRIAAYPAAPPRVQLTGKLVEVSTMPTADGIAPYTGSLLACVYEIETVTSGEIKPGRVLVKHWAMLDQKTVQGFPRETGRSYDLTLERVSDHPELKGERVMDDTTAFDLEPWFDVSPPRVAADAAK